MLVQDVPTVHFEFSLGASAFQTRGWLGGRLETLAGVEPIPAAPFRHTMNAAQATRLVTTHARFPCLNE